jgi:hypothetical protein
LQASGHRLLRRERSSRRRRAHHRAIIAAHRIDISGGIGAVVGPGAVLRLLRARLRLRRLGLESGRRCARAGLCSRTRLCPRPAPGPVAAPGYASGYQAGAADVAACMERYRSYDPASRTYMGRDHRRHPCP